MFPESGRRASRVDVLIQRVMQGEDAHSILTEARIDTGKRQQVNSMLRGGGFDGNGRFGRIGEALNKLTGILSQFGLEAKVFRLITKRQRRNDAPDRRVHVAGEVRRKSNWSRTC